MPTPARWLGTRDVELTFATGALDPSGYTSSTVGEAEYHRKTESDGSSCTVVHRFRDLDPETAELVTLRVTGARGEPDRHCALAATAIQRVVENLPEVNGDSPTATMGRHSRRRR
ncbi:hypothetical protein [Microbacterium aurum]